MRDEWLKLVQTENHRKKRKSLEVDERGTRRTAMGDRHKHAAGSELESQTYMDVLNMKDTCSQ